MKTAKLLELQVFAQQSALGHLAGLVDELRERLKEIRDYANGKGNEDPLALTVIASMAAEMLLSDDEIAARATPKRCEPCRATGAIHCSDPANCGGPWDEREA